MKLTLIFPGQGSQAVGMGKQLRDEYQTARQVFEEVDEVLGEKLTSIMFDGPQEDLTLTTNAQPALMAVSIAALRVLEEKGLNLGQHVSYVAGHSLGEYSALCAASVFSLADTTKLLRIRGSAMQAAVPAGQGGMAAIIGLEQDQVANICESALSQSVEGSVCAIANDNGGGQWVISGSLEAVEKAVDIAEKEGAKRAIMLPVSAPFHCEMMAPAAKTMAQALGEAQFSAPLCPLIANVTAGPVTDPKEIEQNLVAQVTGRVRWRESVEFLASDKVDYCLEVGSGKVLTGLGRRISRDIKGASASNPADIDKFLETLHS